MTILIFGHRGQIGSAVIKALPPSKQVVTTDIDITDDVRLRDILRTTAPDIIINAAAYTNVDGAETESEAAFAVNAHAPRAMAKYAKDHNTLLIHYSTDYVFNGEGTTAWVETDTPDPLNIYGQSKLEGDEYIIGSGCKYLIFRTSWVYASGHNNFPSKILELSQERDALSVISDQIGAPTSARFIAYATAHAIRQNNKTGLYHLSCSGETSWFEFARTVLKIQNPIPDCQIVPVLSGDYPQKAERPLNSRLNTKKFIKDFGFKPPHWNAEFLAEFQRIH